MSELKKVQITGGPHGKNTKVLVEGEEISNLYHVDARLGVHDAVTIHLSYLMLDLEMELEGVVTHTIKLQRSKWDGDEWVKDWVTEEVGDSLPDALRRMADRLEAEAGPVH